MTFQLKGNTMNERELAAFTTARAEVARMRPVIARQGRTMRVHCSGCDREHRIRRTVHGTVCPCGSQSFRPMAVCELPV